MRSTAGCPSSTRAVRRCTRMSTLGAGWRRFSAVASGVMSSACPRRSSMRTSRTRRSPDGRARAGLRKASAATRARALFPVPSSRLCQGCMRWPLTAGSAPPSTPGHMLKSMTGFGTGRARAGEEEISVEVRAVNHKHLEVKVRLPRELSALEPAVLRAVRARCVRGAVDVAVRRSASTATRCGAHGRPGDGPRLARGAAHGGPGGGAGGRADRGADCQPARGGADGGAGDRPRRGRGGAGACARRGAGRAGGDARARGSGAGGGPRLAPGAGGDADRRGGGAGAAGRSRPTGPACKSGWRSS